MPNLINAYVIYNGTSGQFVGDGPPVVISINCERLQAFSPRPAWLKRFTAPGDGTITLYEPTFSPTSPELLDPNILKGFWIEQDGQDVMIDAVSQAAFQQACDACCGSVPSIVTGNYNGTIPAFAALTVNQLCIYRFDDGSAGAHDDFAADYVGRFIGTAVMRSSFSNTSHYTISTYDTYATFVPVGNDTVYLGPCTS